MQRTFLQGIIQDFVLTTEKNDVWQLLSEENVDKNEDDTVSIHFHSKRIETFGLGNMLISFYSWKYYEMETLFGQNIMKIAGIVSICSTKQPAPPGNGLRSACRC